MPNMRRAKPGNRFLLGMLRPGTCGHRQPLAVFYNRRPLMSPVDEQIRHQIVSIASSGPEIGAYPFGRYFQSIRIDASRKRNIEQLELVLHASRYRFENRIPFVSIFLAPGRQFSPEILDILGLECFKIAVKRAERLFYVLMDMGNPMANRAQVHLSDAVVEHEQLFAGKRYVCQV